jgi:general stress protein YciG
MEEKEIELTEEEKIREYARLLGRKGGSASTPAKKRSSKENGKKGGRPKGSKNKPKDPDQ